MAYVLITWHFLPITLTSRRGTCTFTQKPLNPTSPSLHPSPLPAPVLRLTQSVQHKEGSHNVDRLTLMDEAWQWRKTIRSTLLPFMYFFHHEELFFSTSLQVEYIFGAKNGPLFYHKFYQLEWFGAKKVSCFLNIPSRELTHPPKMAF